MNEGYLLLATILVPVGSAVLLMATPSRYADAVRAIAILTGFVLFVISTYLFVAYNVVDSPLSGSYQFDLRWLWMENVAFLGEKGITLHLALNGISATMVWLTGIIIFAGSVVSWKINYRNKDFFVLLFLLVGGVFGVFISLDLFFLFFFYELAVIPMYLLIGVWGSSSVFPTFARTKEYGAMKLTLYLVAGSVLIWVAIFAIFAEAGVGTFDLLELEKVTYNETFQKVFFPLLVLGFGVLAGLWPFHTWSPDGHVAAPTAVSMLHAGVLMKLGAFGILRVGIVLLPEGAQFWMPAILVLGTTGALYGALSAMAQRDFKYVVGYSSVSHMGYVLMGLATLDPVGINGAVLQMFAHGIMTALMFALVGAVYDQAHLRDMTLFGGLVQRMPRYTTYWAFAGLSSLGLPGLAGFVAEFHIFVGVFRTYPLFGALGVLAAAVTAAYILRMLAIAFFGPFNPRWSNLKDMHVVEVMAGAFLIAFLIFFGVWPSPFIDRISSSVTLLLGAG